MPENKELGFVGIPEKINASIIEKVINQKQIPVVAPLGLDKDRQTFNLNGDTAANAIAKNLNQEDFY